MSNSSHVSEIEIVLKVLSPLNGFGTLNKRLPEFFKTICRSLDFTHARLLSHNCGVLSVEEYYPRHRPACATSDADSTNWRRAQKAAVVRNGQLIIPVTALSPDALVGNRPLAVVALNYSRERPNPARDALLHNSYLWRRLAQHIAGHLQLASTTRLSTAHRRLSALQGRNLLSSDMCYQVAHELRGCLRFSGWCGIFRIVDRGIQSISVLPDRASKDLTRLLSYKEPITVEDMSALLRSKGDAAQALVYSRAGTGVGLRRAVSGLHVSRALDDNEAAIVASLVDALQTRIERKYEGWIVCPLLSRRRTLGEEEVIGLLVVASASRDFSSAEVMKACDFAAHCIPSLVRDITLEAEFDLLDSASAVDPEVPLQNNEAFGRLLQILCDRIRVHRNADIVTIIPYENRTGQMRLDMISTSPSGTQLEPVDPQPSEEGVLKKILEAGEFEWHLGTPDSPEFAAGSFVTKNSIASFYAIALVSDSYEGATADTAVPLGVLFVDYKTRKRGSDAGDDARIPAFTEIDKQWIRRYARIASKYIAVQTRTAQSHNNNQAALHVYSHISESPSLTATLETIFKVGAELVGATAGVLAVPAANHNGLQILYHRNLDPTKVEKPIPYGEGVTGRCGERLKPVYIPDTSDSTRWPEGVVPFPWVSGSKSEFAVPLVSPAFGTHLIGVLDLENQHAKNAFGTREREALDHLAKASALALEITESLALLTELTAITKQIREATTADTIYKIILDSCERVIGAISGSIRRLDADGDSLEPVARFGPVGTHSDHPIPVGEGVTGYAMKMKKTVVIADVTDLDAIASTYRGLRYLPSHAETRSEIAVPLVWTANPLGVLNVEHTQKRSLLRFQTFLEGIAHQAGQSLNAAYAKRRDRFIHHGEAVEMISAFARTVLHNVQGPLVDIRKVCESQSGSMPQQAVQDALKSIHEYAIKCLAQTEELRELAPHLGNPVQSLRPRALLDGVVAAVKVRLPPSFHFHIENKAPEMTYLLGREKVLAWCFTQIIENSHNHGGSEVRVTIRPLQTESMPKSMSGDLLEVDRFLEFAFEDDGPGVDSRYLNEVFEWKKAHLKTRGRGEAMALCKVYVGHMDGMIWCSLSDETGLRAGALKMHLALPLELR